MQYLARVYAKKTMKKIAGIIHTAIDIAPKHSTVICHLILELCITNHLCLDNTKQPVRL